MNIFGKYIEENVLSDYDTVFLLPQPIRQSIVFGLVCLFLGDDATMLVMIATVATVTVCCVQQHMLSVILWVQISTYRGISTWRNDTRCGYIYYRILIGSYVIY